ncbi:MAG: FAD-dependent oxidoreductase [Gemmataceae bacterium]|nr:FAD-dependent oxidoreductase [Gemmataceae bacterium]
MSTATRSIVIVGGGFAGVYTARHLEKRLPRGWHLTLFSQENHFIFTPLLGDVVGSSINPLHVVCPIRQMVRRATCRTAALTSIDLAARQVHYQTPDGRPAAQGYDHLVLACGSAVNLDIIPGMAAHGWPLKTMGDALMLHNHLITLLEQAEVEPDPAEKKRLLSVVVVGAGFSGVETAGEVHDLLTASCRFYRTIKAADVRVTLLEGRDRVLAELPASLSKFTLKKMTRMGIDIRLNTLAASVTEMGVRLRDGGEIEARTVVCTIGTTIMPLLAALDLPREGNRIKTLPDFRVEGCQDVWALGDCAAVPNAYDGKPSAPTAQVAVRQGKQLALNLVSVIEGKPTRPFSFKPLGMLASIGDRKGVGLVFGMRVSGFFAWFLWRGVYLSKMPTLARKIQIAFDWAWQLFFPRDIVELNLSQTERVGHAHYEAGQYVFHKGDPGRKFYVIERGRAGVYMDESAPPVAILKPGDHFGEGALLRGTRRSASVRAEEPLDVLVLGEASFGELTKHFEALRSRIERSYQGSRSAQALLRIAQDDPRLNSTQVGVVMSRPVTTLPVGLTLGEALRRSQEGGRGAYPVVDEQGRMVGLCTRTDFYNAWQKLRGPDTPLAEVMRSPVITVRESDPLTAALMLFLREPIKRLVVVADDEPTRPVGMVTPFDLLHVMAGVEAGPVGAARSC